MLSNFSLLAGRKSSVLSTLLDLDKITFNAVPQRLDLSRWTALVNCIFKMPSSLLYNYALTVTP